MQTPGEPDHRDRRRGRESGFTLLELLISITLLAVIAVLMTEALRVSSRSVSAGERRIAVHERFRTVISMVDAQIQSQFPLTYMEENNKRYFFWGDRKNLRFATNFSIWGGTEGYVLADYHVEPNGTGGEVLIAGEQMPGVGNRRQIALLDVTSLSFEYYLKDPVENQGMWVETVTDGVMMPEKIRVNMIYGTKRFPLVIPVRAGGTNISVQGGTSGVPVTAKSVQGQMR